MNTFCDAIETVILTPYRLLISELEKDLLKESFLNVTYLQTNLEQVKTIFHSTNIRIHKISSLSIILFFQLYQTLLMIFKNVVFMDAKFLLLFIEALKLEIQRLKM